MKWVELINEGAESMGVRMPDEIYLKKGFRLERNKRARGMVAHYHLKQLMDDKILGQFKVLKRGEPGVKGKVVWLWKTYDAIGRPQASFNFDEAALRNITPTNPEHIAQWAKKRIHLMYKDYEGD